MSDELIQKRPYFSNVRKAREALKERANEILETYIGLAALAMADKDYETAETILWKLLDHAPEDDEGFRVIDSAASKPPQIEAKATGPAIQIGIALGGISGDVKSLPEAKVIDVSPIHDNNETPSK